VASPTSPVVVFASRGVYVTADAAFSALIGLFIIGPLFGLDFPWPEVVLVVPLTVLVGFSAYAFSTFLAGLVLRWREVNGLVVNATIVSLMTLCGVNVPIGFFPEPLELVASLLPVTNGLEAIRDLLNGASAATVAANAAAEAAVMLGWLTLALASFGRFVGAGRRDGSLEFAS
jgi:ABC-2 type transport system permease protein